MISFESDYIKGAHPHVIKALCDSNMEILSGYGNDAYCDSAKEKIRTECGCHDAEVFFISGGTQTNAIVISSLLREYEGVISAKTGHISVHEAGAIEYTGHKVLDLSETDGKIMPDVLKKYMADFYADKNHGQMVFPGMVYISHPTEYGTLYTKAELEGISDICREYKIPLFMDGARLGYGLASYATDVTLHDIARLCDVFYIGGTKVGALCGEAVVFTKKNAPKNFNNIIKKKGALLAKGRLMGVQFDALFTDGLYYKISRHAIDMAEKIKALFNKKGYRFFIDSPTNQQFIVLENKKMDELAKKVRFGFWEKYDDTHTVVRFATAWSTTEEEIAELESLI